MRVDYRPLPRPVIADTVVSVNMPALHAVGPHDVSVHGRQHRFHVAGVETVVKVLEKFSLSLGIARSLDLSPGKSKLTEGLGPVWVGTGKFKRRHHRIFRKQFLSSSVKSSGSSRAAKWPPRSSSFQ